MEENISSLSYNTYILPCIFFMLPEQGCCWNTIWKYFDCTMKAPESRRLEISPTCFHLSFYDDRLSVFYYAIWWYNISTNVCGERAAVYLRYKQAFMSVTWSLAISCRLRGDEREICGNHSETRETTMKGICCCMLWRATRDVLHNGWFNNLTNIVTIIHENMMCCKENGK